MKTPAADETLLRSPAGLRNHAHECEHSEHSRLHAGRPARAEGAHGRCDHWDHSRRLTRYRIARLVENACAGDESKGTINFINFRAVWAAKARPGSNLGNHQLHQLCVNFGSPRGALWSIHGDPASRRIFRVVAESARVPDQSCGRAEARREHQRERHPDDVEWLTTSAGGT
jgi:hypothetical protein